MALNYKNVSDSLTAVEWANIFTAADSLVSSYFNGLSFLLTNPVLFYGGGGFAGSSRRFYLGFNPSSPPSSGLHPLAAGALAAAPFTTGAQYNHSALLAAVAALAVDTATPPPAVGTAFGVTRLVGPLSFSLDNCLSVCTHGGNVVTLTTVPGVVENVKPWDLIEVIIINSQSFDVSWDKYYFYRFHNFGSSPATVTFYDIAVTIPAGCCKCVRVAPDGVTDTPQGNYLHYPMTGDPRFFNFNGDTNAATDPFSVWVLIQQLLKIPSALSGYLANLDLSQAWDMSSLYCDSNTANKYLPPVSAAATIFDLNCHRGNIHTTGATTGQITGISIASAGTGYTPGDVAALVGGTGGAATCFVAAVNGSGGAIVVTLYNPGTYSASPLDGSGNAATTGGTGSGLVIHAGYIAPATPANPRFTSFADLPSILGSLFSGSVTFDPATQHFLYTGRLNYSTWSDIGTPLIYLLTNQSGAYGWTHQHSLTAADAGTKTTPSLLFDISGYGGTISRQAKLLMNSVSTNFYYNTWSVISGVYTEGGAVTQTLANNELTTDSTDGTWYGQTFYSGDLLSKLTGIVAVPNSALVAVSSPQFLMTPFGPVMIWTDTYPIQGGFAPSAINWSSNFISAQIVGTKIVVLRGYLLTAGMGTFPALGQFTPWHFPRQSRVYGLERLITVTDWEPWNSSQTSVTIPGYLTSCSVASFGYPTGYSVGQIVNVVGGTVASGGSPASFIILTQPGGLTPPTIGLHSPGSYSVLPASSGVYGNLSINFGWVAVSSGPAPVTSYENPNISAFYESKPVSSPAPKPTGAPELNFSDNRSYIGLVDLTQGNGPVGNSTNFLRCQTEHYNLLASQVNGLPVTSARASLGSQGSIAAGNFLPAYGPGGVPSGTDGSGNITGYTGSFPRGAFYSWIAPATGTDTTAAYFTAQGIAIQTTVPDGYGNAMSDGSGGYLYGFTPDLQTAVARYKWIKIDDMRTLYAKFNVPMVVPAAAYAPLKFQITTASFSSAQFFSLAPITNTCIGPSPDGWSSTGYVNENFGFQEWWEPNFGPPSDSDSGIPSAPSIWASSSASRAEFVIDPAGQWLQEVDTSLAVRAVDKRNANASGNRDQYHVFNFRAIGLPDYAGQQHYLYDCTWTRTQYYFEQYCDWGMVAVGFGSSGFSMSASASVTPLVIIAVNTQPQVFAIVPQNYVEPNLGWMTGENLFVANASDSYYLSASPAPTGANPNTIWTGHTIGFGGVVPWVVHNAEEIKPAQITYITGVGASGHYETVISTNLLNAVLQMIPVNGQGAIPLIAGAGGTGGAGGGTGSGGAGGGGSSDGL